MKVTKQFKFELAHRLVSSYSTKCQSIHGHSYIAEISIEDENLNSDGMVVDFGKVKDKFGHIIDAWDHSFMFYSEDVLAPNYRDMLRTIPMRMIEVDYNPTAENMAYHLFRECGENGILVKGVRVQETKTGWASTVESSSEVGTAVLYYNIPEMEALNVQTS